MNSHLTMTSLIRRVDAHFATLAFTNEASLLDSQISITSLGPYSSWHSQGCFSAIGMSKSAPHMNRGSIYTPVFKTNRYVSLRGDRTLRSVLPETQCLSCDRTQDNVRSALTGRVRSRKLLSRALLMLTKLWHPASGHSPLSIRSCQMISP